MPIRLGPDGRPIEEMFPGGFGMPRGYMPGLTRPAGYVQPPPAGGGAPAGSRANPNATLPGATYTPGAGGTRTDPNPGGTRTGAGAGTPPPPAAGQTSVFNPTPANYLNPWLPQVTAGMNNQPVSFASPGRPNTNYSTPAAAGQLAKDLGANLVSQNMSGMASPGSPAPSAPMYGLDFGRGDVQGADVGLTGIARGDSPASIAERYQAGLNTRAFAGPPPPVTNPADNTFWNRTTPVAANAPSAEQRGFFAAPPPQNVPPPAAGPSGGSNVAVQQLLQQMGLVPPQQFVGTPPGGLGGFFT